MLKVSLPHFSCLRFFKLVRGFLTLAALGGPFAVAALFMRKAKYVWLPFVIAALVGAALGTLVRAARAYVSLAL